MLSALKHVLSRLLGWFNPLSANFTKWSNTFKQLVGNLPTNCLGVLDHFVGLALKGLKEALNDFLILDFAKNPLKIMHENIVSNLVVGSEFNTVKI